MASDEISDSDVSEDTREQGIEFGQLQAELDEHDYPASGDELVAEYGEFELELPGGSTTVGEVLGKRHSEDGTDGDIQYESPEDVHRSIHIMVGSDAVGREDYTDRGGSQQVADGETDDQESI